MNIEVFKTTVNNGIQAGRIIEAIHRDHDTYRANFDLQDCDRILRIVSFNGPVQASSLIELVRSLGFDAEVLPDL